MPNLGSAVTDPDLLQQLNQPQPGPNLGSAVDPATAAMLEKLPAPQEHIGSLWPVSTDPQGHMRFDPNAGFLGGIQQMAKAAMAPGDVYSGKLRTPYSGSASSEASPEIINRSLNFATAFGPMSAALRAGEIIPGEIASGVGVPTAQHLKTAATEGYDMARASPLAVAGSDVANMARQTQQTLQTDHGIIAKTAPKTYALLDELANPPQGAVGTYPGLEAARRGLSTLTGEGGTEGFAAQKAIPQLDQFIDAISPHAADARANYAAAMRSNSLTGDLSSANTGILEQAEARANASHSGTNIDNAIRQRVASLLQSPQRLQGFSQPEIDALNNVVEGGTVRNAARKIGNYLGGGGGLGGLAATAAGAALGGHMMPGIEGTALGAALPTAIGTSAKGLENALARRSLSGVDELVRARSPLAEAMSGITAPAMGYNSAAIRALPALLSPQQFPPSLNTSPLAQFIARGGA